MVPARNASTSEQASSIHGCSIMGQDATGSIRHPAPPQGSGCPLGGAPPDVLVRGRPLRVLSPSGPAQVQCGRVLSRPGPSAPADAQPDAQPGTTPEHPFTLAIDVGGTGLKASVLSRDGSMVADRVKMRHHLPDATRRRAGRGDADHAGPAAARRPTGSRVASPAWCAGPRLERPALRPEEGPGLTVDSDLFAAWSDFDLAAALRRRSSIPTRVANDADVQGAAVVNGNGLEVVITLGTGFGSAVFMDGSLLPHIELAHHPFRKDETYNEQVGEVARKKVGDKRWNHRVREAIGCLDALFFFDHLYIGGGNARRVDRDELGDVLRRITVVDNTAGILGGIKLWEGAAPGRMTPPRITLVGGGSTHWTPTPAGRLRQHRRPWPTPRSSCTTSTRTRCRRCSRSAEHIATVPRHRPAAPGPPPTSTTPSTAPSSSSPPSRSAGSPACATTSRSPPATASASRSATASGPGGISRALRSVPVMVDIARAVERARARRAAPQREQPAHRAVPGREHGDRRSRTVGLCNEIVGLQFALSLLFDGDMHEVDPVVAGVNHLPLVTALRIGDDDGFAMLRDVLENPGHRGDEPIWMTRRPPACTGTSISDGEKWTKADVVANNRVKFELFQRFGVLPGSSDTHVVEFFPGFVTPASDFGRDWGVHHYGIAGHQADKADDDARGGRAAWGRRDLRRGRRASWWPICSSGSSPAAARPCP